MVARTSRRSCCEGMSHSSDLSRRPGRSKAESIKSGRLSTSADYLDRKMPTSPRGSEHIHPLKALRTVHFRQELVDHSISHSCRIVSSAHQLARRIFDVDAADLFGAIESNSSKNKIQGLAALARSKRSRTDFSLAPIYLFRISGPFTEMKLRPHSLATADASIVFPHPG